MWGVHKRHCQRQLKRGNHWQYQGRWEFGEHETFVEVWRLGCPFFNTRSFWSLRPPAPAAAWSETLKIILQQGRGGCGDERAGASATTSISHQSPIPGKSTPPKHRQSLCLHPRGTQDRHTQNTTRPKKHGEVFNFRSGRKGLAARLMVGLVRGSNVGCPGATTPGAHNPLAGTPISIGVHACSP